MKKFWGEAGRFIWFYSESDQKYFFFNFPWTGNWENISFWQSQHVKLPAGNNLTAPSSCSVKSTFLVLSRLLIAHLGFPSSCRGSPALCPAQPAWLASPQPCLPAPAPAATPQLSIAEQLAPNSQFPQVCPGSRLWRLGLLGLLALGSRGER